MKISQVQDGWRTWSRRDKLVIFEEFNTEPKHPIPQERHVSGGRGEFDAVLIFAVE